MKAKCKKCKNCMLIEGRQIVCSVFSHFKQEGKHIRIVTYEFIPNYCVFFEKRDKKTLDKPE